MGYEINLFDLKNGLGKRESDKEDEEEMKPTHVKLYANYGTLFYEKQIVWSLTPRFDAVDSEPYICELPEIDGCEWYVTISDHVACDWDGTQYLLSELLTSIKDEPYIERYNGRKKIRVSVKMNVITDVPAYSLTDEEEDYTKISKSPRL